MALILLSTLPDGLQPLLLLDENFAYLLAQIAARQIGLKLTTVGANGPATLDALGNLNIPNYAVPGGATRIITGGGPIAIGAADQTIILNLAVAAPLTLNLPAVATRNQIAMEICDFAGNAGPITVNPAAGETIMGLGQAKLASAGPGVGTAGLINLAPSVALAGWYQL